MSSSPNYVRDYAQEYKQNQSSAKEKKRRASRNKVRRASNRSGRTRLGDGKDVDHANTNPLDNSKKNLRVQSKSTNRSFPRNKKAGKK